jgi:hypothetical protein
LNIASTVLSRNPTVKASTAARATSPAAAIQREIHPCVTSEGAGIGARVGTGVIPYERASPNIRFSPRRVWDSAPTRCHMQPGVLSFSCDERSRKVRIHMWKVTLGDYFRQSPAPEFFAGLQGGVISSD